MTNPSPQPKVIQLSAPEWQALALHNVAQLHHYISQMPVVTDQNMADIEKHFDQFRDRLRGWKVAAAQQAAANAAHAAQGQSAVTDTGAAANGAAKPKGKGGWPKGKPRRAAQPAAAVQ